METVRNCLALATLIALSGILCSCSGAPPTGQVPAASLYTLPPPITGDDWVTFAHDYERSAEQSQNLGLTETNLSGLALRWSTDLSSPIFSSPLVYGGLVIAVTDGGTVYALDAKTGSIVWQRAFGIEIRMTPTIADDTLFVGTHLITNGLSKPSSFYALDLTTGAIKWQVNLPGTVRGDPIVVGGRVILDVAGGDPPACLQGGVYALNETTGSKIWYWNVDENPSEGGGVWSPISYNGSVIVVGTGNTCQSPVSTANSVVGLNPVTGKLEWTLLAQANSEFDDDTGGGPMLYNGLAYVINKNGKFYAINSYNGSEKFVVQLNAVDGAGGYFTPSTDGTTIVVGGGTYTTSGSSSVGGRPLATNPLDMTPIRHASQTSTSQTGELFGLDFAGNIKWTIDTSDPLLSYVAIYNGIGFVPIGNAMTAIDLSTGTSLWSYQAEDLINAGAAIVPSGLYFGDNTGNVYAFSLPSASTTSAERAR